MKTLLFIVPLAAFFSVPNTIAQTQQADTLNKKGHLEAGYGNRNNVDVKAGYLFDLTSRDKLKADFTLTGMKGAVRNDKIYEWNDVMDYNTHAALDYRHDFMSHTLSVGGNLDVRNFDRFYFRKQNFTAYDVHLGFRSTDKDAALQYHAEVAMLKYERKYYNLILTGLSETIWRVRGGASFRLSDTEQVGMDVEVSPTSYGKYGFVHEPDKPKENDLLKDYTPLQLNPYYRLQRGAWDIRIGAHLDASFGYGKKFYASPDVSVSYQISPNYMLYAEAKGGRIDNDFRRLARLNPYAAGVEEEYYLKEESRSLYEAPHNDEGGYFREEKYGVRNVQPEATYEQLNAAIGLKASPFEGFQLHLYGGYQILQNDMASIEDIQEKVYDTPNGAFIVHGDEDIPEAQAPWKRYAREQVIVSSLLQMDSRNLYLGADIRYDYRKWLSLQVQAVYRHWTVKSANPGIHIAQWNNDGAFSSSSYGGGYNSSATDPVPPSAHPQRFVTDKPAFTLDASLTIRPVSALSLTVGYKHLDRQKPKSGTFLSYYTKSTSGVYQLQPEYKEWNSDGSIHISSIEFINENGETVIDELFSQKKIFNIRNLYAEASWEVLKDFALYVHFDNLLDRYNQYYPGYPSQKLSFLGGIKLRF
jgi:hypothetical protein